MRVLALGILAVALLAAAPGGRSADGPGLPAYPGAEPLAAFAEALGAYQRPAESTGDLIEIRAFVTDASFDSVAAFYRPHARQGKRAWRERKRQLLPQARHLAFARPQLVRERGQGGRLPDLYAPLFGAPAWSDEEFAAKLDSLAARHADLRLRVAEGVVSLDGPLPTHERIVVERPYLDPSAMRVVDRTRVQLIRITRAAASTSHP